MSHHSASNYSTGASQSKYHPRVRYFIIRNDSTPVPLVPVDELPEGILLQGVPAEMLPEETYGMKFIGYAPFTGSRFALACDQSRNVEHPYRARPKQGSEDIGAEAKPYLAPDSVALASSEQSLLLDTEAQRDAATPGVNNPDDRNTGGYHGSTHLEVRPTNPVRGGRRGRNHHLRTRGMGRSGFSRPDQTRKEYCTHWITKGTCDYGQQGCRFKHVMPTKAKLEEMEIFEWPEWWVRRGGALRDRVEFDGPLEIADEGVKKRWWRREAKPLKDVVTANGQADEALECVDRIEEKRRHMLKGKTPVPKRELNEIRRRSPHTHPERDRSRRSSNSSDLIQLSPSASVQPLRVEDGCSNPELKRQWGDVTPKCSGPAKEKSEKVSTPARTQKTASSSDSAIESIEEQNDGTTKHVDKSSGAD